MSASGVAVFDKTLQTTNIWLDDLMADQGPDRQLAWHVLGAVLHTLRDRLPIDLAAHLSAQLPPRARRLLRSIRSFQTTRPLPFLDEFLEQVNDELSSTHPVDAKEAVRSVFRCFPTISIRARCGKCATDCRQKSRRSGRIRICAIRASREWQEPQPHRFGNDSHRNIRRPLTAKGRRKDHESVRDHVARCRNRQP